MDRRDRRMLRLTVRALAVLIAVGVWAGVKALPEAPRANAVVVPAAEGIVERVTDGDTLKLSDGRRIRLIGVDTPELHESDKLIRDARRSHADIATIKSLGTRAYEFTKSHTLGRRVRLEFDVERRDRYGRTLAYVHLEDGTFLNALILQQGYGQIMTIPPNVAHADEFRAHEREAREAGRGLWSDPVYRSLAVRR